MGERVTGGIKVAGGRGREEVINGRVRESKSSVIKCRDSVFIESNGARKIMDYGIVSL
jgi:hypothetical protein